MRTATATTPFALAYARWFAPLASLLGVGPGRSALVLDAASMTVRMGWAFGATIPRARVLTATRHRPIRWAIGVHMAGSGDWIVNGTAGQLVELRLDPPVPARALGLGVRLRRLRLSVDRPDELRGAEAP